ncbi:MAG: FAD-dependent oxidoreductase [Oscillospiraceae bacterium]|jgi:hypothetical protein|nr:FAD-dependent oxidoreductase [Oscillospiraceae bacterium]
MLEYKIENGKVLLGEQAIPVAWKGDVLVAGGGPGGLGAAFLAHRNGLNVLLIEELGFLGGMASYGCGMPLGGAYPAYRTNGGFAEEIMDAVRNAGKDAADVRVMGQFSYWFFHDSEYFKSFIAKKVVDEKLPVRLHTTFCDVLMDGPNRVVGVVVESKSGRQALLAKTFIDATGDADLCARAGAQFEKGADADGAMMATTVVFSLANVDTDKAFKYKETDPRFEKALAQAEKDGLFVHPHDKLGNFVTVLRKGTIFCNSVRVRDIDGTSVEDLTRAELESRVRILQQLEFMRRYIPGCEDCYLGSTGDRLGVRETRRIIGEDRLTVKDVEENRKRPDVGVIRSAGPYDNASRGKDPSYHELNKIDEYDWYHMPYGSFIPKGLDNVAIAGRTFCCDYLALTGARGIALMMCIGEATGTAAAYAINRGVPFRDVDVAWLQNKLRQQGCNIDN